MQLMASILNSSNNFKQNGLHFLYTCVLVLYYIQFSTDCAGLDNSGKRYELISVFSLCDNIETFGRTCNVKEIERNINIEISKVTTWLPKNKLQLNVSKSKFMMFFKHPKTLPKLNITANGNLIGQVSEFNFLGITIDENITWNPHIRNTSIKIARVIGILRKLKRILPRHILRLIYNSLIHPHLLYGLSLWGFKQKRITVLQKKAVRIIAFRAFISHSTSAFK